MMDTLARQVKVACFKNEKRERSKVKLHPVC